MQPITKTDPRELAAVPIGATVTMGDRHGIVTEYRNEQPVVAWEENAVPATPEEDDEYEQAQREAIDKAHRNALAAHQHWVHIADILTELRRSGTAGLIDLPTVEEWWEPSNLGAPFDIEEFCGEMAALSGPITKAHTLAVIYARRAEEFEDWLADRLIPQVWDEVTYVGSEYPLLHDRRMVVDAVDVEAGTCRLKSPGEGGAVWDDVPFADIAA